MTGEQAVRTSTSATAFRTISGPMPAGSPIVIPTRGLSRLDARVTRASLRGEGSGVTPADGLFFHRFRRFLQRLLAFDTAIPAIFALVLILDVVFQQQQVGTLIAVQLDAASVIPLDASF